VLAQMVHYAPRVRRDALQGLRELLSDNPWCAQRESARERRAVAAAAHDTRHATHALPPLPLHRLLPLHAARIFGVLAPRITDADREVRVALRALLAEEVLTCASPGAVAPFIPLLSLHTAGAMTNLDGGVRRDALGVLDLLLAAAPGAVSAGAPAALLRHFVDLLAGGPGGVRWSPAPLGAVVASLHTLLTALLQQLRSRASGDGAGGGSARPDAADAHAHAHDVDENAAAWAWAPGAPAAPPLHAHRAWGRDGDAAADSGSFTSAGAEPPVEVVLACTALTPRLLAIWGQLAPGLMDPGGVDAPTLACLTRVLRTVTLCASAARAAGAAAAQARAAAGAVAGAERGMQVAHAELLLSLRRHFPVSASAAPNTPEGRAAVSELNLSAAELLLLEQRRAPGAPGTPHAMELLAAATEFVSAALRSIAAPRGKAAAAAAAATAADGAPLAPVQDAHPHLLRLALAALLHNDTAPTERELLLGAVTTLWEAAPARSPQKAATLRLLRRCACVCACLLCPNLYAQRPVLTLTPHARARRILGASPPLAPPDVACRWLSVLPRLLFDLRHAQPEASLRALDTLLDAARFAAPGSPTAHALAALEPELAPFFAVCVAGRTPRAGPFLSLPPRVQVAALSLLGCLPRLSAPTLRALALCALSPSAPPGLAGRAAEAVAHAPGAELALRLGWMGTLLLGHDASGANGVTLPLPQTTTTGGAAAPALAAAPAAPAAAAAPPATLTWAQRREVVHAACVGLASLAPCFGGACQWDMLAALWPATQQAGTLAQPRVPRHVSYAFLHAAADAAAAAAAARDPPDDAGADMLAADDSQALPQELAAALPALLCSYLVACASEGALSVPPDIAPRAVAAGEPGIEPAAALLALCTSLAAPTTAALAAHAREQPAALPDCLTALAALVARPDTHAALLHGRGAVEAAAAALTADAAALRMPHAAVARHLGVALRHLFASA
jgi:pre-rRNA-processing protein IPI1